MTSYFDDAARAVRAIDKTLGDEAYLAAVADIEKEVIRDVILCTGDREFPSELREKLMTVIACNQNLVSRKDHDEPDSEPTSSEREDWAAEEKHDFIKEGR